MAKNPVNRDTIKKMIDTLTPMNPQMAEKFVQDLLRVAEERRKDVERVVGDVAKIGVRTAEGFASSVQNEMSRQVSRMATRIEELERQVESLSRSLDSTRSHLADVASRSLARISGGADVHVADGSQDVHTTKKPKKSVVKAQLKADKKAEKKARRLEETGSATDDSGAAVSGI